MSDTLTNGMTESAMRALVHKELKFRRERDDLKEQHKASRNHVKTYGIDLKNFDAAINELLAEDGGSRFVAKLAEQHRLMKLLDLPVAKNFAAGDQLALPLEEPKLNGKAQTFSAAFRRGANAHLGGFEESDNPHNVNTPEGQDWLEGYRYGVDQLKRGLEDIKMMDKGENPADPGAAKGTIPARAPRKSTKFAGDPVASHTEEKAAEPEAKKPARKAKTKKKAAAKK